MEAENILDIQSHKPLAFFGIDITLGEDSVREWVRWCHKQGMRGFNIIVATDCEGRANGKWIEQLLTSYGYAFDEAEKLGLEAWIFDDWGYPSGTAGGLVCTDDSLRAKKLYAAADVSLAPHATVDLGVIDGFLSAGVYYPGGSYETLDFKPGEKITRTSGDNIERFVVAAWKYFEMKAKSRCKSENDPAMSLIDMLKPEAAQKFTQVMHELYKSRFQKYFGKTIKGFFYDEPYLPFPYPWTEKLPEEFEKAKGYSVVPLLPRILTESTVAHKNNGIYVTDFYDVWTAMAAKNYYGVMADWCHQNGLEFSGHADLDHRLNTLSTVSGHFFKNMAFNDRPAHDVIWAQIEPGFFADFPRFGGSVKRILGKKSAITETFAAMGMALHSDLMRYITDYQAIRGIDEFHLMYSSNKHIEPYSPLSPYHMNSVPFGALVSKRIAAGSAAATFGRAVGGTALYMPCYDLYRWQMMIGTVGCDNSELPKWKWVEDISKELCYLPCAFDYIWDEAITSLELKDGGFIAGEGYKIDTVILPPNCMIPDNAAQRLNEFAAAGGRVISVFRSSKGVKNNLTALEITDLKEVVTPQLLVSGNGRLSCSVREKDGVRLYMLLNESREAYNGSLDFETGNIYKLDLLDGSLTEMPSAKLNVVFEGAEMQVYLSSPLRLPSKKAEEVTGEAITLHDWSVETPDGNNTTLPEGPWPDWTQLGYPSYSGSMSYRASFSWSGANHAKITAPGLRYQAVVLLDGKDAGRIAFRPYSLDLGALSAGVHTLELKVYNTSANQFCGTPELEEAYPSRHTHMLGYDKKRLKSGLESAPVILPVRG